MAEAAYLKYCFRLDSDDQKLSDSAMPKIIQVRSIAAPPTALHLPERVEIPSPDGEWNLVFHTPREWHMGADGWQVKLFHRGRDVTRAHRDFFSTADPKGFRFEQHFHPWSFDSKSLAMVTWNKKPVHIYEVAARKDKLLSYQPAFGLMYSAQFAPDIDRLLLTFPTEGLLVDQRGEQQALVQWTVEQGEVPYTYWMKTGNCFFLMARPSADSKTRITFYSGVDGALKETYDLDPNNLAPYRWEDYVDLPRDKFSLQWVDPPIRSVGSLLDSWNSVQFDRASNTLVLAVSRPVSPPFQEGGELLCKVEQRWFAVELESS